MRCPWFVAHAQDNNSRMHSTASRFYIGEKTFVNPVSAFQPGFFNLISSYEVKCSFINPASTSNWERMLCAR